MRNRYATDAEFRDRMKATATAWQKTNRDRRPLIDHKRRDARGFVVTSRDLQRLLVRHDGRCAYCRTRLTRDRGPTSLEWDHVVSIHHGGRHSIGNLVPACRSCN